MDMKYLGLSDPVLDLVTVGWVVGGADGRDGAYGREN